MIERHLRKLRARDAISPEEEAAIRASVARIEEVPDDQVIVPAGKEMNVCTILLDGIACRRKDLSSGERQITELHVPGDYMDLHSFTLKRLDHDVVALSPCALAFVPHAAMADITERFPHLTRVYWFSTNLDAAIHREWVLSLGRRQALSAMAHLFCELYIRLELVGLARDGAYDLPLTQTELSECLGISAVHTNRALQELRDTGTVEFRSSRVQIADWDGLQSIAEFDPAYLYLERRVR